MSLGRLFWSEAEFFKEFASHIPEPLKDAHAVDIQDETVFILLISFQFFVLIFAICVNFSFPQIYTFKSNSLICIKESLTVL